MSRIMDMHDLSHDFSPTHQEAIKQRGYSNVHMDVWTLEELEECRRLLFPDQDPTEVNERWHNGEEYHVTCSRSYSRTING